MTYQRYHGSCHCQAVQYEAEFDLAAGTNRCNCSLCSKARAWFLFVRGDKFKLLSGDDVLSTYQWVPPGRAESGLDLPLLLTLRHPPLRHGRAGAAGRALLCDSCAHPGRRGPGALVQRAVELLRQRK